MSNLIISSNRRNVDSDKEIQNFESIAAHLIPSPGDIPELAGIDVYGKSIPLNGIIGGDHIIYLDFKKRYDLDTRIERARAEDRNEVEQNLLSLRTKAGIAIADVSGHLITDGLLALMLHQSFLLGAMYELDYFGEITIKLFENLNSRFFRSSGVHKYLTLLYGEITEKGRFRFISAAHPLPVVFSRRFDRFMDIAPEHLTTFPPIGTLPSQEDIDHRKAVSVLPFKENYEINEINLMGAGDILLLSTDGLTEHSNGAADYFPAQLEKKLREVKDLSAREICQAIENDLRAFGPVQDDLSYVVLKKL